MVLLSTKIYSVDGVDVREDTELCGKLTKDNSRCQLTATRLYLHFKDMRGDQIKTYSFICNHQEKELRDAGQVWFNAERLISLAKKMSAPFSTSMNQRFKEIHDEFVREHTVYLDGTPIEWKSYLKPETRKGKGNIKEFDCTSKKKYEDLKLNSCGDVWNASVLRNAAKNTCVTNKLHEGHRRALQRTLFESGDCSDCGHELSAHESNSMRCIICNKYCAIGEFSSEKDLKEGCNVSRANLQTDEEAKK